MLLHIAFYTKCSIPDFFLWKGEGLKAVVNLCIGHFHLTQSCDLVGENYTQESLII